MAKSNCQSGQEDAASPLSASEHGATLSRVATYGWPHGSGRAPEARQRGGGVHQSPARLWETEAGTPQGKKECSVWKGVALDHPASGKMDQGTHSRKQLSVRTGGRRLPLSASGDGTTPPA